jgi:hypothetical protein
MNNTNDNILMSEDIINFNNIDYPYENNEENKNDKNTSNTSNTNNVDNMSNTSSISNTSNTNNIDNINNINNNQKSNIGKRWTKDEENKMIKSYNESKLDIIEIAKQHNRLPKAISMRLVQTKIIKDESEARGYNTYKNSEYYKQQIETRKLNKKNNSVTSHNKNIIPNNIVNTNTNNNTNVNANTNVNNNTTNNTTTNNTNVNTNDIEAKLYILEKAIQEINRISNENKENIIVIKYLVNIINEQNKKLLELNKLE